MFHLPDKVALPLKTDEDGNIRVSNTRVTLVTLLTLYRQGEPPEAIHEGFPTVPLADIYAIIGYYLAHQDELDSYLRDHEADAERIQQKWESHYTPEQQARIDRLRKGNSDS